NPVAIKQYTAQDFSGQTREEIRKEARIMATVSAQSDYLVRLRGVILDKPNYSLVMEYLPGGDLFHLLKSSQEMTWPMRYRIGLDMTIGLHHLHGRGALHRDLKSLNVLLDMNFRAKLADFGLSTLKTSSASTTAGGFKGTVLWSAPELFKRGAKADRASDIYSLGMILWELVSRQIPFADAATPAIAATWVAQGDQEIVPEGTPEEFKVLILDCWNKDPAKRPQADAVAKRLDTLWQSEQKKTPASPKDLSGIHPGSLKPETPASSPPPRQPQIKKPVTLEPAPPPSSSMLSLSQGRFTIAPAPKPLLKPVDAKTLEQLLQWVAEGEQDKAEALIQKDPNLLRHAGTVKDLSGREFKGITAFQYALWAMDYHMWTMIKKYLPRETQVEQWQALESKGTAHGIHFSLKELTDVLQVYMDNAEKWNYDQRAVDQWCKKVGGAQTRLPAHVVNEYCRSDRPFEPCPTEWESKLPRTREMDVYDSTHSEWVKGSWFIAPSSKDGLGLNYAFARGQRWCLGGGCGARRAASGGAGRVDLKALHSLWKTRTQQLELLRSQLLSVTHQPQTYGSR
ncbi:MAG: protein kinase, partial [Proteobacteria bacterium]|nr:protein kinase [Pseudomonadota bacterium]